MISLDITWSLHDHVAGQISQKMNVVVLRNSSVYTRLFSLWSTMETSHNRFRDVAQLHARFSSGVLALFSMFYLISFHHGPNICTYLWSEILIWDMDWILQLSGYIYMGHWKSRCPSTWNLTYYEILQSIPGSVTVCSTRESSRNWHNSVEYVKITHCAGDSVLFSMFYAVSFHYHPSVCTYFCTEMLN